MSTFAKVFADFGGPARLAEAIGIEDFHAQTMKTRDSIPAAYFLRVEAAAQRLGLKGITVKSLAAIAEAKAEDTKKAKAAREAPLAPDGGEDGGTPAPAGAGVRS